MQYRMQDHAVQEVINICDGCRPGYVADVGCGCGWAGVRHHRIWSVPRRLFGGEGNSTSLRVHPAHRGRYHPNRQTLPAPRPGL